MFLKFRILSETNLFLMLHENSSNASAILCSQNVRMNTSYDNDCSDSASYSAYGNVCGKLGKHRSSDERCAYLLCAYADSSFSAFLGNEGTAIERAHRFLQQKKKISYHDQSVTGNEKSKYAKSILAFN